MDASFGPSSRTRDSYSSGRRRWLGRRSNRRRLGLRQPAMRTGPKGSPARPVVWRSARWMLVLAAASVPLLLLVPPVEGTAAARGDSHRLSAAGVGSTRGPSPFGEARRLLRADRRRGRGHNIRPARHRRVPVRLHRGRPHRAATSFTPTSTATPTSALTPAPTLAPTPTQRPARRASAPSRPVRRPAPVAGTGSGRLHRRRGGQPSG